MQENKEKEFLKKRAKEFLELAKMLYQEGKYNLSAFHFEQACQLFLKYYLFLKLKDFPKTHSLKELLFSIGRAYKIKKEVRRIYKENFSVIADLEEAYITSRYLPAEFSKEQVKEMLNFSQKLISFLKKLKP